jgi:plasmid stabilization system protein ParE
MEIRKKLQENPHIFGSRSGENRVANFRTFPYQVYYYIDQETVVVFAVLHAYRDRDRVAKIST